MSTAKQAQQEYRQAARALADNLNRKRILKEKAAQLEAQLDALSDKLRASEKDKLRALDTFVLDESQEDALKLAKAQVRAIRDELEEADELKEAHERALAETERIQPQLQNAVNAYQTRYCRAMAEEISGQIPDEVKEIVMDAFAARSHAGGTRYEHFLPELFPCPIDEQQIRRKAFREKYLTES